MNVRLVKTMTFEAAHWLPGFPDGHKCRRMHGHSFRVEVIVEGEMDRERGYLIDYGDIGRALDPIREQLDHHCLNDVPGLENPTSEMIAVWLWERLTGPLPMLAEIVVHETCSSRCHYRGS